MSASVILTASTANLRETWVRQLPGPDLTPPAEKLALELKRPGAKVWVKDLSSSHAGLAVHEDTVVIAVGEPNSVPFAEAERSRGVTLCLSYDDAARMLTQCVATARELAERRTVGSVLSARQAPTRPSAAPFPTGGTPARTTNDLDFVELALDHLADRPIIVDAFRRGLRTRLRASKVAVFLREGDSFAATAEGWHCSLTDSLVGWLQEHAAIVDAETVETINDPLTAARVRQLLASWNARLLLPLEVDSQLGGWITLGPRADARAYGQEDYDSALSLASLLARLLCQHRALERAQAAAADFRSLNAGGRTYQRVPAGERGPDGLAVEEREVLGQARQENRRIDRELGTVRISAGPLGDTGEFWVLTDPQGGQAENNARKVELERFRTLHDLGLILAHEQSNALFSFSTYLQHQQKHGAGPADPAWTEFVRRVEADMARLKAMPHLLDAISDMPRRATVEFDVRRLVNAVAKEVEGLTDISDSPVLLQGHEDILRAALVNLCQAILESREGAHAGATDKIQLRVQERARGAEKVCLITVSYPGLRLDQLKTGEAATVGDYPTTGVFLAREVVRYHHGTIHIGQGLDGPELCVSLKSRYDVGTAGEPVGSPEPTRATPAAERSEA